MKKILIVYSKMVVGGSTTSLLSLLNSIDYNNYQVDLLLLDNTGVMQDNIDSRVNLLDNSRIVFAPKGLKYYFTFLKAYFLSKVYKNSLIRSQYMSAALAKTAPKLEQEYDVAIAFLEFWPSHFVMDKVNAKKKILWLHFDYPGTGLNIKPDREMYKSADAIVTVSDKCAENFQKMIPECADKVHSVENIISKDLIVDLAKESIELEKDDSKYTFITVARVVFIPKGHDRAIRAFAKIKKNYPMASFRWLVVGDGPDLSRLKELIKQEGLEKEVFLLGERLNPHPFLSISDIFLLPTLNEGRPMSVTEAQMNGVIPFVTNYASAHDQINNGIDGMICENTDQGIYQMLDDLFSGKIDISSLKKNIIQSDYTSKEAINKVYELLN